jgi:hypothetical protein
MSRNTEIEISGNKNRCKENRIYMKELFKITLLFIIVLIVSCNKKEKPNVSTWTVNGETFTGMAEVSLGKAIAILSSNDIKNRFSITFYQSYPEHLPREGKWPISAGSGQDPNRVYVDFHYNNKVFIISPSKIKYLEASTINEKASYTLNPTWYISYDNPADSVLIQGTFNQP